MTQKFRTCKTSFARGELMPEMALRVDTEEYAEGALRLRNVRLLEAGGWTRRPGSRFLREVASGSILVTFDFDPGEQYALAFSAGRMDAYLTPDGDAAGSVSAAPWTAGQLAEMTFVQNGDVLFVAHQAWPLQLLRRTGLSSWALSEIVFADGIEGQVRQPYYKFAGGDVTLVPSAVEGRVNLDTSEPYWISGHVGTRVRWIRQEIVIVSVLGPTRAVGDVVDKLPPSYSVEFEDGTDADNFRPGQVVEDSNSGTKFEVAGRSGTAVLLNTINGFGKPGTADLVGPGGSANIDSEDTETIDPQPSRDWDDQLFSAARGFCGAVAFHGDRLILAGHEQVPDAILGSRVGNYFDFEIGSTVEADTPFFEAIGAAPIALIRHIRSEGELLLLTDRGPYYLAETDDTPLSPTSIVPRKIGEEECGSVAPGTLDNTVLLVEASGRRITELGPTSTIRRPWEPADASALSSHLIRSPVASAFVQGLGTAPERYGFFVNSDGTLAVYHSFKAGDRQGWVLWTTDGLYRSACQVARALYVLVERTIGGVVKWFLERFDLALQLDCSIARTVHTATVTIPTVVFEVGTRITQAGDRRVTEAGAVRILEQAVETIVEVVVPGEVATGRAAHLPNETLAVVRETESYGPVLADAHGNFVIQDLGGPFTVEAGLYFGVDCETLPPEIDTQLQAITGQNKRIVRAWVDVQESCRFSVRGSLIAAHPFGSGVSLAPPKRTGPVEFAGLLGWSRAPTITLTQDAPLPLTVRAITYEVVF